MAKEWILNMATNRWGLNKKNIAGQSPNGSVNAVLRRLKTGNNFITKNLPIFLKARVSFCLLRGILNT